MKTYLLSLFVVICIQAVYAGNETEQHKFLSMCEWFYNHENNRDTERKCSDCIKEIYKVNADPTDEEVNKCQEGLPQRFQKCKDCDKKVGRLVELHNYRLEVGEIFRKFYTQILTTKEQFRLHQVWVAIFIIHMMNKEVPKADMKLLINPVYKCLTPGTTAASEEETEAFGPGSVDTLMSDLSKLNHDLNTDGRTKRNAEGEDATVHRTLIKNCYKKVFNLYVCSVNAIMSDRDAADIMKDYMKTFEGVVPAFLAKMIYRCPSKTAANES